MGMKNDTQLYYFECSIVVFLASRARLAAPGGPEAPKPYAQYGLATQRRPNLTQSMVWRPRGQRRVKLTQSRVWRV